MLHYKLRGSRRLVIVLFSMVGIAILVGCGGGAAGDSKAGVQKAPVRVAAVARSSIEENRVFSGSIRAKAEFMVAPKVGGRIERLAVDVADTVERGAIVAELDDAEFVQEEARTGAEVKMAEAGLTQAENALKIARRGMERIQTLRVSGVSSESQFDVANADFLSAESELAVAEAQLVRAQAAFETARLRRSYTGVIAEWSKASGDGLRVVAERYVNEGDTVSSGDPLFLIVELSPITGVFSVTERDYGRLREGQAVRLITDALPGQVSEGVVSRIAPIFAESSRQARVEVEIANEDGKLKPGMFVRAEISLERREETTVVPIAALAQRGDATGVFQLTADHERVVWVPVVTGLKNEARIEIVSPELTGYVVTLGQNLVDDGSAVLIPEGLPEPL